MTHISTQELVWALTSICCCCIVTSALVYDLLVYPLVENDREAHLEKTTKAYFFFALLEMVSACVLSSITSWGILPLILLCLAWFVSGISLYSQHHLAYHGNTYEHEDRMYKGNIIRTVLWLGRFACLFGLIISN